MDNSSLWYTELLNKVNNARREQSVDLSDFTKRYFGFIKESSQRKIQQMTMDDIVPCIILRIEPTKVHFMPYKNNEFDYELDIHKFKEVIERYEFLTLETRNKLNQCIYDIMLVDEMIRKITNESVQDRIPELKFEGDTTQEVNRFHLARLLNYENISLILKDIDESDDILDLIQGVVNKDKAVTDNNFSWTSSIVISAEMLL